VEQQALVEAAVVLPFVVVAHEVSKALHTELEKAFWLLLKLSLKKLSRVISFNESK
jgi:hypothetical protein